MYAHHSFSTQAAADKQRSLMAQAERDRRAQQFPRPEPAAAKPAASRRIRRAWQLVRHLRPRTQS